jgi:ABC-type transport system involved in multi-copper enzyme maturation permease subunit
VMLRGAEFSGVWHDLAYLLAFFLITMLFAIQRFQRKLD